ncbi:BrnA antitoxin family protein [Candidatus Magnetomonas plexicatena]|uniref:BrnA antitoxin family protein n=1 Tax=Candidatus Magnetomonas plexicatena TaxID=2552947 RepID=UPI001C74A2C6|nr:BrnA antitoxin family protein [Nitrospirales bacterium LBB_01]
MARKVHIVKYTDKELSKLIKREGTFSDWDKAAGMTQAEIETCIASDSDEAEMLMDWDNVTVELPHPKAVLNMRIDKDVLDYFRKTGRGYQSLINAVLRSYVQRRDTQQHHKG